MCSENLNGVEFAGQLANLFYAIAAADKQISEQEIKTSLDAFQNEWKKGGFTKLLEKNFNALLISKPNTETCFESFQSFTQKHSAYLTKAQKIKIWNTADAIASSFANKNKSEVILLAKLKNLLMDIP
ncbi:hypothetical protein [Planktosalinus lacus]|uniref:Uncharacterized protein n=1 Tax=Planktosalinus lacus TaxID=1526573 RepID=A0A8J2VAK6_9FLAO|nr:hypothetical protein [Planktosalinus lacus]GGD92031.1 hypothetical protein GCM10011312_14820 [Planktosalinus lacus]